MIYIQCMYLIQIYTILRSIEKGKLIHVNVSTFLGFFPHIDRSTFNENPNLQMFTNLFNSGKNNLGQTM